MLTLVYDLFIILVKGISIFYDVFHLKVSSLPGFKILERLFTLPICLSHNYDKNCKKHLKLKI